MYTYLYAYVMRIYYVKINLFKKKTLFMYLVYLTFFIYFHVMKILAR